MTKKLLTLTTSIGIILALCSCKEKLEHLDTSKVKIKDYTLVEVANVEISNDPIPIFSIGKVASDEEVKLSFKTGGIISEIRGKEGQSIRKGAILAGLHTDEIDAQVSKAHRALQKAGRDLDRVNKMYNEGAATLENIQDLTTLVEVSRADVRVAEFNQQYSKIESPVFGRIVARNGEAGELVGPGQTIFIISSRQSSLLIKASLSDKDISKINYGDKAKIHFDAYPDETFHGSILRISESADPRTGTFGVDIEINENQRRFRNGYIGRVEIFPKQIQSYYKIPIDGLVEGKGDMITLFIPDQSGTIATEISVVPEYIGKDYFTVTRSSEVNIDRVVTTGAAYLADKDKIQIK